MSSVDPAEKPHASPASVAEATVRIIQKGKYSTPGATQDAGVVILDAKRLKAAAAAVTILDSSTPHPSGASAGDADGALQISLFVGDSYEAAEWLQSRPEGARGPGPGGSPPAVPCVLDFASDSEPGGGWRSNQQGTQEEDLCRRSSLGLALEDHYRRTGGPAGYLPSKFSAVYVPEVAVIRRAGRGGQHPPYRLMEEPRWVSVIAACLRNGGDRDFIRQKVDGVLRVAQAGGRGHRRMVLGAWGCGAFGNEAAMVAEEMLLALRRHRSAVDHVVFAIPGPRSANFEAFREALLAGSIENAPVEVVHEAAAAAAGGPGATVAGPAQQLGYQHKWQLLSALSEVASEAGEEVLGAGSEYDLSAPADCKRAACALMDALHRECLGSLAREGSFPEALLEQLRALLSTTGADPRSEPSPELPPIEADIRSSFTAAAQEHVRSMIRGRRPRPTRGD